MGRRERRRFADEFNAGVVGLVRSGRTVAEVRRDLDLTESAVRTWVHRAEDRGSSLSPGFRSKWQPHRDGRARSKGFHASGRDPVCDYGPEG